LDRRSRPPAGTGLRQKVVDLDKEYHFFKLAKFGIAAGTGFLLAEGILTLGVFLLYGRLAAPSKASSSPAFLAFDVAALALGVALSFFLNERFTVQYHRTRAKEDSHGLPIRLLKFEGVNALGNAAILGVQFALLAALAITPVVGNVVGAIVAYPITYLMSMHFVWKPDAAAQTNNALAHHRKQPTKNGGPLPPPVPAIVFVASLYLIGRIVNRTGRWKPGGLNRSIPAYILEEGLERRKVN
jgi:putative flippase GtrA